MNYILQLTAAIEKISMETEFNPSHVSLYLALFHHWNTHRFINPISINRSEMMNVSKIGSKSTYHKCLKELHEKGFLIYHPSNNPLRGSVIDMTVFWTSTGQVVDNSCTTSEQVVDKSCTSSEQVLVPYINSINNTNSINNKKNTSFYLPSIEEVKEFFENDLEAEKYFNYYSSKGWVVGNKSPMKDWKAAARNWKMNAEKFSSGTKQDPKGQTNRLHVNQNKDYSIPL